MPDYIEREQAVTVFKTFYGKSLRIMLEALAEEHAADVRPVVLCRDCKQYGGRPWENNESGICARTDCGVGEDDFCSYGEKLEES